MANAWKIARKGNAQLPLVIVITLNCDVHSLEELYRSLFVQQLLQNGQWSADIPFLNLFPADTDREKVKIVNIYADAFAFH